MAGAIDREVATIEPTISLKPRARAAAASAKRLG